VDADHIKQVLKGISIPPQPQIMVDLQMEQVSPDCTIRSISDLISHDVGLAGFMLKAVNSALFSLPNKVTSVQQACQLLGVERVVTIVNALSVRGALSDENIVDLGGFWDSAAEVATMAATIARQLGVPADEAYTVGLLHNCGIPLLMQRFPNYSEVMQQAYAHPEPRIIDVENNLLQTNHAVVGYYVAKSWHLPEDVCVAIRDHHSAQEVLTEHNYASAAHKNLLAILKMAEHLCGLHQALGNQNRDYEWEQLQDNVLNYVGFSTVDFEQFRP
jgi:putative nucleotidyltransferase with HDIG domain